MSDWQAVRPDPWVLLRENVEARDGAGRLTDADAGTESGPHPEQLLAKLDA